MLSVVTLNFFIFTETIRFFLQLINNKVVLIYLAVAIICIFGSNICIFTAVCPYIWHLNTTTVFIDNTVPSAVLHNKIIDWTVQPILKCITIFLYFITGFKVLKVRRKIQSQQNIIKSNKENVRKLKMEHALVLQGLLVTIPSTIIIIVFHIEFYVHDLPLYVTSILDFTYQVMRVLGSSLNPMLHLLLNKDLRRKTIERWCSNISE